MKTTASTGRWLALFVAAFILLSNGAQAQTTYNWAKLSGTGTGIVNDGVPQKLNWSWSPGGASISGTVNITRSGAHTVTGRNERLSIAAFPQSIPSTAPFDADSRRMPVLLITY